MSDPSPHPDLPRLTPSSQPAYDPGRRDSRYGNEAIAPYFFVIIFVAVLVAVGYVLLPFIGDMVIALLAVVLLSNFYERLSVRLGNRPTLASLLTVLSVVVVGAVPVIVVSSALFSDIRAAAATWGNHNAYVSLNEWTNENSLVVRALTKLAQKTGLPISPEAIQDVVVKAARDLSQGLYKRANAFFSGVVQLALHGLITLFSIFYLLINGPKLRAFLFRLSPLPDDEDQLFITKLGEVGRAILIGNGIGSSMQGLVAGVAWAVVGLPSPVL